MTRRDRRLDAVLAAVLLAGIAATAPLWAAQVGASAPVGITALWALAITAPLALRRRFPGVVAAVVAAVYVAGQVARVPEELFGQIAVVVAVYSVSAWSTEHRLSRVVQIVLGLELALWIGIALAFDARSAAAGSSAFGAALVLSLLQNVLVFGGAVALGETSWLAAHRLASLDARTEQLVAERERSARQAVGLERMRIARDLHDVVAHHVSVMGLQAAAGRRVLRTAPDRAEQAFAAIEDNARAAIGELHGMLHSLRTEDGVEPMAPSTVGIAALADLVDATRESGTDVALATEGDAGRVSPVVGMTVYRVVQEALTNVRKHAADGATATVHVGIGEHEVRAEVIDRADRRPDPASLPASGNGMGMIGMRERVAAVGGTFTAGPEDDGYAVRIVLPVGSGLR